VLSGLIDNGHDELRGELDSIDISAQPSRSDSLELGLLRVPLVGEEWVFSMLDHCNECFTGLGNGGSGDDSFLGEFRISLESSWVESAVVGVVQISIVPSLVNQILIDLVPDLTLGVITGRIDGVISVQISIIASEQSIAVARHSNGQTLHTEAGSNDWEVNSIVVDSLGLVHDVGHSLLPQGWLSFTVE
jgi:hypothetical protein